VQLVRNVSDLDHLEHVFSILACLSHVKMKDHGLMRFRDVKRTERRFIFLQLRQRDARAGAISRFEKATGIQVESRYTPHHVYYEKVSAAVAGKNMPDVLQFDAPFLANFVWNGYLAPVAPYVDEKVLKDMTKSSVSQCTSRWTTSRTPSDPAPCCCTATAST
jgi:hypothetical protein